MDSEKHKIKIKWGWYLLITVLFFAIFYSAVWLIYYNKIVNPHITEYVVEEPQMEHLSTFDFHKVYAVSQPADKSAYCIFVPGFGSYSFYVGASSGQSIDDGVTKNANGSDFNFMLIAEFNIHGAIKSYKFNVMPVESERDYNLEAAFFNLNENGELLNSNDLSENEIQLYNDAKQEMIEYIIHTKQYFAIGSSK